jgi:hypothetical protein
MNNSCKNIEENLSAYLDQELTPEESEVIEKHLAECSECNKKLLEFKQIWEALDYDVNTEDSTTSIFQFYSQTLPKYIRKTNIEKQRIEKIYTILEWMLPMITGIVWGILIYQFFDFFPRHPKALFHHMQENMLEKQELLENYEIFQHYSAEQIQEWKQNEEK